MKSVDEDDIKRMVDLYNNKVERKSLILIPTSEGYVTYQVAEEVARHAIYAEGVRKQWVVTDKKIEK